MVVRVKGMATRSAVAVLTVAVVALVSACGGAPMPVPSVSASASRTPSPGPTAKPPVLRPSGNAAANKEYFDYVNLSWNVVHAMSDSQSIVNNLVAAGFNKADMEVTDDTTALNIPVDSIQVSVRIKGECLIGGFSNVGYTGIVAPLLGTGTCLVGKTLPIDW
jgi:hypothetical protein